MSNIVYSLFSRHTSELFWKSYELILYNLCAYCKSLTLFFCVKLDFFACYAGFLSVFASIHASSCLYGQVDSPFGIKRLHPKMQPFDSGFTKAKN